MSRPSSMSTLIAILLNILVAAILYIVLNKKIDRQLNPKEMLDRIGAEVEDIIKELNHTTERNIGLIEDRVESLKSLLESTDRRLAVLRREAEKHEMSNAVYTSIVQKNRKHRTDQQVPATAEANPTSETRDSVPGSAAARSNDIPPKRSDVRDQVLELHRKGISPSVIAGRVGSTIGEVELIISLQGSRKQGELGNDGESLS